MLEESPLVQPGELGPYRRVDYMSLPDEPHCELLYGRFYLSPSPSPLHQYVVFALARVLEEIAARSGGIAFLAPLDVFLADHSVPQPDVIYISRSRRSILDERIEGAPDLLVEVLSPGTARRDRLQKLNLYLESGVREYWLVDPVARQIEFLVNEGGRFVVSQPAGREYQSPALPEIRLDLLDFWGLVEQRLGGIRGEGRVIEITR